MKQANVSNESALTRRIVAILVVLALLSMLTLNALANALANALPLNGVNTGQLSDEIPNLFVPTGLTFAIWGLIYLMLLGYALAVLNVAFRGGTAQWSTADGWLFVVNALANAGWIVAWHWRLIPLSMLLMLVILATLIVLQERNYRRIAATGSKGWQHWLLTVPINVYLGWICVATIANATALFVTGGWNAWGLDPRLWTVVVITAGLAVAVLLAVLRQAVAAPLVVVWAYLGIVLKRLAVDPAETTMVWLAAALAGLAILVVLAVCFWRKRVAFAGA